MQSVVSSDRISNRAAAGVVQQDDSLKGYLTGHVWNQLLLWTKTTIYKTLLTKYWDMYQITGSYGLEQENE